MSYTDSSDSWFLTIIFVFIFSALLFLGYVVGSNTIKDEAVVAGAAIYTLDKDYNKVFVWTPKEHKSEKVKGKFIEHITGKEVK